MKKIGYYVAGHTGKGFVNYLESNCKGLTGKYILEHPSHLVKTELIKRIAAHYEKTDAVEMLYSSFGSKYLDGCIIRGKSLVIIDDAIASDMTDAHVIKLGNFDERDYPINERIHTYLESAYDYFSTGLNIHDSLEDIYVGQMDFAKADKVTADFLQKILQGKSGQQKSSCIYHRLFGTNTPNGFVNIVRDLLDDISHSYFIKGRAGTGKSTFMKKVLAACCDYGYDIELYHCSFDPESVDMVLVRDLDFCIFDSTDPHELFPQQAGEEIVDMYKETVTRGTDEKYANEINSVNSKYKSYMKKGLGEMAAVGKNMDEIDARHKFSDERYEEVIAGILSEIDI